jgi:Helix-turn-helix domain/Recombinase
MAERLNFREACQHAGVSRQRLNQAIASGRLPAERGGGPGKPTYITLEDLQAWCVSEGLAMPVEAIERLERSPSTEMAHIRDRLEQMFAGMIRLERLVEQVVERLERSQSQAIARGIRQVLEEFKASTPLERSGTSTEVSHTPRSEREDTIARIRQAKDVEGKSYQQIANEFNAEGIPTFSGKGTWEKGSVHRFYKGH